MDLDWDRLGAALQAARQAMTPKLKQEELAAELGVGRSVIQLIERGHVYKKPTPTIRAFARRVGWTDESVDRVLAGGEPEFTSAQGRQAPQPTPQPSAGPALPQRIQHELDQEGDLLDTVVIPLGDGASAVVVVKNPAGATPEQRQRNLDAWLRMQSQLRQLDYTDKNGTRPSPAANGS
jgi:transcriptional regulator with XRE-family HTH domain